MIYKRCGLCGARLPEGTRCQCRSKRHREYDQLSRNKEAKKFYNSAEWKKARAIALGACGGMDAYSYYEFGTIIPADTVHHIIPLLEDWNLRTDQSNLLPLSHSGHSAIEQQIKKFESIYDYAGLENFRRELREINLEMRKRER